MTGPQRKSEVALRTATAPGKLSPAARAANSSTGLRRNISSLLLGACCRYLPGEGPGGWEHGYGRKGNPALARGSVNPTDRRLAPEGM